MTGKQWGSPARQLAGFREQVTVAPWTPVGGCLQRAGPLPGRTARPALWGLSWLWSWFLFFHILSHVGWVECQPKGLSSLSTGHLLCAEPPRCVLVWEGGRRHR